MMRKQKLFLIYNNIRIVINYEMAKDKDKMKVVFLGEQSTGKTSILTRFIQDKFEIGIGPTVGIDFMAKTLIVSGKPLRLQFWDTAGQERFRSLIPNYLKEAVIAFLVFDLTNEKSYANLPEWIDLCNQNMPQKSVMVLLGNKADLTEERQVTDEAAKEKAGEYKIQYFEVSAKTGFNIKQSLNFACEELIAINEKARQQKFQRTQMMVSLDKNQKSFNSESIQLGSISSSDKKDKQSKYRCC